MTQRLPEPQPKPRPHPGASNPDEVLTWGWDNQDDELLEWDPVPPGTLEVRVKTASEFLSSQLRFEVTDGWQRVVATGTSGWTRPIPSGLYSVALLSPDGTRSTQMAEVQPGEPTTVSFTVPAARDPYPDTTSYLLGPPAAASPAHARIVSLAGCEVTAANEAGWVFHPITPMISVPTVTIEVETSRWELSLPLNPQSAGAAGAECIVSLTWPGETGRLRTDFGPERRVARFMAGVRRSRDFALAEPTLDQASELLYWKYEDPPAAALGGLILHRLGVLPQRAPWVENLAGAFPFIPDSQVLLASLLRDDPDAEDRTRGLDILLAATTQRPLYTDGLALAMELLRYWPDDDSAQARAERLAMLAEFSVRADWNAVTLSVDVTPAAYDPAAPA